MKKKKITAAVYRQERLAEGIYDMWIETGLARTAEPGQFLMIYPRSAATLLPRPISICEADRADGRLRVVYRVAGQGTAEFASYRAGEAVQVMGTLGNGFPLCEAAGKRVVLMGGGIGIPPMLFLAEALSAKTRTGAAQSFSGKETPQEAVSPASVHAVLGYRDGALFLKKEIERYAEVAVATEDGSAGTKGNVLDAIAEQKIDADIVYACGPMPMLRAVKRYAQNQGIPAYLSLEERMACGVGACLGCVCRTKKKDAHSHVNNARVCTEGPVFPAEDVDI